MLTGGDEKTETLGKFLTRETHSRYFNPKWIEGMQGHGYAGAREMSDFVENLWGWEATNPDLISDDVWISGMVSVPGFSEAIEEATQESLSHPLQTTSAMLYKSLLHSAWSS